jgi:hypothetical protein
MNYPQKNRVHVSKATYGNNLEVEFYDATNTAVDVRWYAASEANEMYVAIRQWVRDGIL